MLHYQKTQAQGTWGRLGFFFRELEEKENLGEPFLFPENYLKDPVSLLCRIRKDLFFGEKCPERLSLNGKKKLTRVEICEKIMVGNPVHAVLKQTFLTRKGLKMPKELEISLCSADEPVSLKAKLVWGISVINFESKKTQPLDR